MSMWTETVPDKHSSNEQKYLLDDMSKGQHAFLSNGIANKANSAFKLDMCNNTLQKSPKEEESQKQVFSFMPNISCRGASFYQMFLLTFVIVSFTCLMLILCRDYIKDLLVWLEHVDRRISFLIFVILYIVVSYPMAWGVILLMLANGYLYGIIYGPVVVTICSAIGIAIAHVTMKNFCRSFIVKKFYNDKMSAVISVVGGKHGFKVVALTRLTPVPFGLQNSLFSLTDISLAMYVTASSLGMLPTTVLNCYMGTTLRSMQDVFTDETNQVTGYIMLAVQILFTIALMFFVIRKAKNELKKTVETNEPEQDVNEIVIQKETKPFIEKSKLNGFTKLTKFPSHKRAHSAS